MKVTVCFDSVRVIVPCGNGELTVTELIQRAVSRYRKATNKPPDEFIQVHFLETSEDHGILDPDDMLCDVVDDKDKLLAVFQEGSSQTLHHPAQNGGYGTSASSVGTASPDLSQHEDETPNYIEEPPRKPYTSINNNKSENTNGEIKTVSRVTKSPPPPVPPKPVRHISVNSSRSSHVESIPSEDSGISSHDDRYRISSDSSKSETIENVIVKPTIYRTGEATFVAIRTPVKQTMYNGQANTDRRRFSSTSSDHADNEHSNSDVEEETFSLGRNSTRKSMFVDSPMLDRWAELQEERMFVNNSPREEPVSTVTSPSEPSSNEPDFAAKYNDDQRSESSESSGEPDMLMIELRREDPLEPLGFTVAGYRTADSRELGLIVRNISPSGCAARDGRLEIADRIVEVNGWSLLDMPNERAEELFAAAIKAPVVNLGVSRSHSFVPGQKSDAEHEEEVIQARPAQENSQSEPQEQSQREMLPSTPQSLVGSPSIPDSSFKKVNKRILIELMKGNDGLGFSITTRDNPAGGNTPIFVKSILPKGAAIEGGQLKAGDQIVEVNGQKMAGKSQAEAVNTLRSTRGLVTLLVQREEVVQPSRTHAIEVNEDSLRHFREEGLQVLTFKIPLDLSGAAGLGVSVKGKSRATSEQGRDSPQDKGIFVKSIIPGGAAAKDNRLCPDDQLLRVNNKSLVGLTNQAAMETLRLAMQSTRPNQAFIDVTIAREQDEPIPPPGELQQSRSLEELNAPDQERPIEAVSVEEPQRGTSETDGGVPNKDRHPSSEEDQFNESITNKNLSPIRARNAVHRNDSYCVAVNKSQSPGTQFYSPFRQRPVHRPSPLAMGNNRAQPLAPSSLAMASSSEASTLAAENVPTGRPTSTVAIPTPPVGTTDERPPGPGSPSQAPSKLPPPLPPPRWDSAADNYRLPAGLQLRLKMPDSQKAQEQRSQEGRGSASLPSTPPPPAQFSNQSPTTEFPPSYDQAVARLGRSPHASVSSEPTTPSKTLTEDSAENQIIAPPSPFSSEDGNPFQRDGFGRLSMSEKRGRAALDARQSEYFIKRDQERNETDNSEDGEVEQEETNPTIQQHPLRRADSEEQLRQHFEDDSREEIRTSPYGRMQKSRSTGQLKLVGIKNVKDKKSKSNDNLSFTSAVENANRSYPGDFQNGHARFSPSEEEVPITMKSNADFSAVQQKLAAKKPFYKGISSVFKIGKTRRGDYSLSDGDGSAFKHTYNREALIDFPSEQRYRQLVNHYGQEKPSDRSNTLPTRSRKKHEVREKVLEEKRPVQTMKVGRVTVTAPTRV